MNDSEPNAIANTLGQKNRILAAAMGSVWIAAGFYGVYRAMTTDPWSLALLGALAIIYGSLWLAAARNGRWGRIPLWP